MKDVVNIVVINPALMVDESGKPVNYEKASELKKWFRDNLVDKTVTTESDSRIQTFTNRGLKASLKRIRSPHHNEMYAGLAELIKKAVYDRTIPVDEKHKDRLYGQEVYYATAEIGKDLYSVEMRLDIPKNTDDLNYKDHEVAQIKIEPSLSHARAEADNMQDESSISTEPLSQTLTEVSNSTVSKPG